MLVAFFADRGHAEVTPYPRVPGDEANSDYVSVRVNGVEVDTVGTSMNVGYAHFAFAGTAKVEIAAKEPIETFDLSPHRLKIPASVAGNVLTLQLTEPRKLHLRVNGLSRFFIFAEAPERNAPQPGQPGVISVGEFGVVSDPQKTQTEALQRAIDQVAETRGVLHVPPGIYRTGRLLLRSNLSLYLAPGAIIKGTGKLADYPRTDGNTQQ
ncbi:MAG TPA: hypothetical protein VEA63_06450, partial [Opitutus sp.]|nr:hypothetical protein [Opitutus sp.]